MTTPSSSLSLALLGSQVARRLLRVLARFVGLLVHLAIAAWTRPHFFSRGVGLLAVAIFASRRSR
jgi:hypothetical protein